MGAMMKVLFEDNHTIAVVKEPNIPVMPDISGDECLMDVVKAYLKKKYNKPGEAFLGLVHRLDRPTGGVIVFAKTSKGASRLSEQIRSGRMDKVYLAVVEGYMEKESGSMDTYLLKDRDLNKSKAVTFDTAGAKKAVLEYNVLREKNGLTLVEVHLITGRHHQIRAQFSQMGHPVFGDTKYGAKKKGYTLALWSRKLTFYKPVGNEPVTIKADPDYCSEPWSLIS
jgi:23S rRNA pseudouridine1911/1915/1917 synthase